MKTVAVGGDGGAEFEHDEHDAMIRKNQESAVRAEGGQTLVRETTLRNDIIPLIRYHQPCHASRLVDRSLNLTNTRDLESSAHHSLFHAHYSTYSGSAGVYV